MKKDTGWNEMRLKEMKFGKKSSGEMKRHEVQSAKCKCDVLKCNGEARDACEVWRKFSLDIALRGGRTQVMFLELFVSKFAVWKSFSV